MNNIANPTVISPDNAVPVTTDSGEPVYRIPLGLCKQAVMKIESAVLDIMEIGEDEEVDPQDRATFVSMTDILTTMAANIINIVKKEMDEDDFLAENLPMDELDSFPEDDNDFLDEVIETKD